MQAIPVPPAADVERQQRIQARFRTMPPEAPQFEHYGPAEYLTQRGHELALPGLDDVLDRFEELFSAMNALLPKGI